MFVGRKNELKLLEDAYLTGKDELNRGHSCRNCIGKARSARMSPIIRLGERDFQNTAALDETRDRSIMINDYLRSLNKGGWLETHTIQAPMSSQRFEANVVEAMQKKKIIGKFF